MRLVTCADLRAGELLVLVPAVLPLLEGRPLSPAKNRVPLMYFNSGLKEFFQGPKVKMFKLKLKWSF
jgi:hypothetical protein